MSRETPCSSNADYQADPHASVCFPTSHMRLRVLQRHSHTNGSHGCTSVLKPAKTKPALTSLLVSATFEQCRAVVMKDTPEDLLLEWTLIENTNFNRQMV